LGSVVADPIEVAENRQFVRFWLSAVSPNQMININHLATLLQPDPLVQEFALTVAHALALALVAWMLRQKPRSKP
jgi:hypothetical protein